MDNMQRTDLKRDLGHVVALRKNLSDRFFAEVEFARRLAKIEGEAGWEPLIQKAEHVFGRAVAAGSLDNLQKALEEAEGILAPIGDAAKAYTVHCVGHGHIDMNWMWSWPETVAVTNDTFLTVLKLMDEFPDFIYTQSQASVYEIVRVHNPDLFEAIKRKVKEGRWEVAASHWVEGDKNLASGESLTRHLLYTRRFMKEHFGLEPEDVTVDWSPDTFGHAWSIPSVDAKGAVKRYYLCRGGDIFNPPLFWWRGPDGDRVLVNREKGWYNSEVVPASAQALLDFVEECGMKDWMQVYGVGDHGGGPTRRDLRLIIEMNGWPIFPNFRFSTTRAYFDLVEQQGDKLPVIDRELNFEFAGCYTSQSEIKRNNRLGENACGEAEVAAALAHAVLGRPYPAADLEQAWREVLFSHFHDILPGSGVAATRTYNQGTFQQVIATTSMVKTQSLRALAAAVDTSFAGETEKAEVAPEQEAIGMGGGAGRVQGWGDISTAAHVVDGPRPFVIFNPTAWPRKEVVTATVWDAQTGISPGDLKEKTFIVRAPDGTAIPAQRLKTGDYWGHKFVDLAFPAEVPALGYAAYSIEEGSVAGYEPSTKGVVDAEGKDRVNRPTGEFTLENEYLIVGFDRVTGGIIKLVDKASGMDLADPARPMGILEYTLERPQNGSAWILGGIQKQDTALEVEAFGAGVPGSWSTDVSALGPHVATATSKVLVRDSRATVTYELKAGQPWIDITVEVRWLERGASNIGIPRLSMRFPVNVDGATALYEIPFATLEREAMNGREVPALRFADVNGTLKGSGEAAGVAVLNDCKYGHSLEDSTLHINLIRSTYEPDPLPEIGDHEMRMAIVPHAGPLTPNELVRLGAGYNVTLQTVSTDVHTGTLPASSSTVESATPNVLVTQIKRAEDSDDLIVRLQETEGMSGPATVRVNAALLGKVAKAAQVDLIERDLPDGTASPTADGFTVAVPARGIASVRVKLAK